VDCSGYRARHIGFGRSTVRVASKLASICLALACHPSLELPVLPIQKVIWMSQMSVMPDGTVSAGMSPKMMIVMMSTMQWTSMAVSIPMHNVGRGNSCGPGVAEAV
jgi:hypothetical protein